MVTDIGMSSFFDCYDDFPAIFQGCCQYLLASVIYHLPTLRQWWPEPMHPVWQSRMFVNCNAVQLEELRSHIRTEKFVDHASGMTATGIPNIVRIHERFDDIEAAIAGFTV